MTAQANPLALHETLDIALGILKQLDTPYARQVRHVVKNDMLSLKGIPMPEFRGDADIVRRNWLAYNLVRKAQLEDKIPAEQRAANAVLGYLDDEHLNAATNQRLRLKPMTIQLDGHALLFEVRNIIDSILGDFCWDEWLQECKFSSGSSTRLSRAKGHPYHKMGTTSAKTHDRPHVTPSSLPYAIAAVRSSPSWTAVMVAESGLNPRDWFHIVPGGKLFTVPKDFEIDRVAEQNPDMNLFLQKGLGSMIRKRLRRVGINLNDQTVNGRMALEASRTDGDSTLDLKSASNSVTTELVKLCIRPDWADHLFATRTEWTQLPSGAWHRNAMMSSMGNGFTFELESLVFYAMARVICNRLPQKHVRIGVYGDDIIVPKAAAGWLVELLEFSGFRVNTSKSFFSGPFRESCGVHAYRGIDVTPFMIREPLTADKTIVLANQILHWSAWGMEVCDLRLKRTWDKLHSSCASFAGPSAFGDACLHDPDWVGKVCNTLVRRTKIVEHRCQMRGLCLSLMYPKDTIEESRYSPGPERSQPWSEGHLTSLQSFAKKRRRIAAGWRDQLPSW